MIDCNKLFKKCMKKETKNILKASDIQTFTNSPFWLYCKYFVDESEKDPIDEYQTQLLDQGIQHERTVKENQYPDVIPLQFKTPEEGFMQSLDSMMNGINGLLGCPLYFLPLGMYGVPDILERKKGKSDFGSYHYIVKEVKLARNIKKHHVIQAAFYNLMIGQIQGYVPDVFYLINMDEQEIPFEFVKYENILERVIEDINNILDGQIPSPTFGSCPYPWKNYCDKKAVETRDISLINGLGIEKKKQFHELGLKTIDDLISCTESDLLKIKGVGKKTAQNYMVSAKALTSDKVIRKTTEKIILPKRETEIFLDLEGLDIFNALTNEEDAQTDYLIGVLVRNNKNEEYIPFVAHDSNKEEVMLRDFLKFIKKQKNYVIYHWHHYEKTHLSKMMEKYNIDPKIINLVLSKDVLFDLHKISTNMFAFPVPNTSIKSIAKWMGFEWKHKQEVNALNSISLYHQYIQKPNSNKDKLDLILDYNRDDCKATAIIKDWLVQKE